MVSTPAIPAATLVLVRERERGAPELLMVERSEQMAFAGGALVFPGGRIDEADGALGRSEIDSARTAAIRETIEETAIPVGVAPLPDERLALALQRELLSGMSLTALTERHSLSLHLEALTPFARWVPKFHATRRFDTYFFLARSPGSDWQPRVVEGECSGARWLTAAEALERDKRGEARLIFPTRRNLERLALHSSFDAMIADATAHSLDPITPWVEEVDGENFITIADGIGYPVTRERLGGLWRG